MTEPASGDTAPERKVVVRDKRKIDAGPAKGKRATTAGAGEPKAKDTAPPDEAAVDDEPEAAPEPKAAPEPEPEPEAAEPELDAELEGLRSELDERTKDLQRITAEYANYRKRIDRDRGLVVEQAIGGVLSVLLPIMDDLDRARDHGDLVGPFGAVAEQLTTVLGKFGLTPFGEQGDPFDPMRHEAVAHRTSPDVTEPTCVEIMRRGYLLGDRLLRPALVAVADPE